MASDVMEDVGFRKVVELVGRANGDGGGEFTLAEAIEELEGRNVAADGFGAKASEGLEEAVYVFETGDAVRIKAEGMDAFQEMRVGETVPFGEHSGVETMPGFVVFGGVEVVRLVDEEGLGGGKSRGHEPLI
jgi:hypothetical protein